LRHDHSLHYPDAPALRFMQNNFSYSELDIPYPRQLLLRCSTSCIHAVVSGCCRLTPRPKSVHDLHYPATESPGPRVGAGGPRPTRSPCTPSWTRSRSIGGKDRKEVRLCQNPVCSFSLRIVALYRCSARTDSNMYPRQFAPVNVLLSKQVSLRITHWRSQAADSWRNNGLPSPLSPLSVAQLIFIVIRVVDKVPLAE